MLNWDVDLWNGTALVRAANELSLMHIGCGNFMSSYFSVIGITEFSKCVTAPLFVLDSQSGEDNRFLQGALNSQLWHSALSS